MKLRLIGMAILLSGLVGTASAQIGQNPDLNARAAASVPSQSADYPSRARDSLDIAPELLGGPVAPSAYTTSQIQRPQPTVRTKAYSDVRVILTDAARDRIQRRENALSPGAVIETSQGLPVGRISTVERGPDGRVTAALVRPPNSNSGTLRHIPSHALRIRNGRAVMVSG